MLFLLQSFFIQHVIIFFSEVIKISPFWARVGAFPSLVCHALFGRSYRISRVGRSARLLSAARAELLTFPGTGAPIRKRENQ